MGEKKNKPKKRLWLRWTWGVVLLLLGLSCVVWFLVPRVIERELKERLLAAGVEDVELRVSSVGIGRLVIDDVALSAEGWAVRSDQVTAVYSLKDFWKAYRGGWDAGLAGLDLENLKIDVYSRSEGSGGSSDGSAQVAESSHVEIEVDRSPDFSWVHQVRDEVGRFGEVNAPQAMVTFHGPGRKCSRSFELSCPNYHQHPLWTVEFAEGQAQFKISGAGTTSIGYLEVRIADAPSFIGLIEEVTGAEALLPDEINVGGGAVIGAECTVKGSVTDRCYLGGGVDRVRYGGDRFRVGADRPYLYLSRSGGHRELEFDFRVDQFQVLDDESEVLGMVGGVESRLEGRVLLDGELHASVVGLSLAGEKNGVSYQLDDIAINAEMSGDRLTATGALRLGGNRVPLAYEHTYQSEGDAWNLKGSVEVEQSDFTEPVDTLGVILEDLAGSSFSGGLGGRMDFSSAHDRDFDGSLEVTVNDGTLVLPDGPTFEGIEGVMTVPSMETMATESFQKVTVKSVDAWDMELTKLKGEYQLLADGGVALRGVSGGFLGGRVGVDAFTIPGGDDDYDFTLRMKNLDVAKLAEWFPEFNGTIDGRLDGVLPIKKEGDLFWPQRGSLKLSKGTMGRLRYDAQGKFSAGHDPRSDDYKKMKLVEESLENLELKVLSLRLFDPADRDPNGEDKAVVVRIEGKSPDVRGAPPIILNVNGFMPEDEVISYFDLLFRHRDKLNFGL